MSDATRGSDKAGMRTRARASAAKPANDAAPSQATSAPSIEVYCVCAAIVLFSAVGLAEMAIATAIGGAAVLALRAVTE